MNVSIGNAISQVKNALRAVHADRRLTVKYIYSVLDKHASWLIKQESDKLLLIKNDNIWQILNCVKTEEVPQTDDCCIFTSKCTILRTKEKLPTLYQDGWGIILRSVDSIDFSQSFQPIKLSEWTRKLDTATFKYDKTLYCFYKNERLYFPNCDWKLVSITGFFKEDISKYNYCEEDVVDCPVSILDAIWRVPEHLQSRVIDFTIKELTSTLMQVPPMPEVNINKNPS